MNYESRSAASERSLARFGLRIVRAMQTPLAPRQLSACPRSSGTDRRGPPLSLSRAAVRPRPARAQEVVRSKARCAIRDTRGLPAAATVCSLASKDQPTQRTAHRFMISERAADPIQEASRTHGATAGLASNRQETK